MVAHNFGYTLAGLAVLAFAAVSLLIAPGYSQIVAAGNDKNAVNPKTTGEGIVPLHGRAEVDALPLGKLEDLNQCAGTLQHYRLPPTGYTPAKQTSKSANGKELYTKFNCMSCHSIDGSGGQLGPPLDGIGGHRGQQWLVARLLDPENQMREFPEVFGGRPNIMPHMNVAKKEAAEIAEYLLTLAEPKGGFLITAHPAFEEPIQPPAKKQPGEARDKESKIAEGKDLFVQRHCAMCHTVDGSTARFGPRLNGLSTKYDQEQLSKLLSGAAKDPGMKGSSLNLKPEERENIIEFLLSLPPSTEPQLRQLD